MAYSPPRHVIDTNDSWSLVWSHGIRGHTKASENRRCRENNHCERTTTRDAPIAAIIAAYSTEYCGGANNEVPSVSSAAVRRKISVPVRKGRHLNPQLPSRAGKRTPGRRGYGRSPTFSVRFIPPHPPAAHRHLNSLSRFQRSDTGSEASFVNRTAHAVHALNFALHPEEEIVQLANEQAITLPRYVRLPINTLAVASVLVPRNIHSRESTSWFLGKSRTSRAPATSIHEDYACLRNYPKANQTHIRRRPAPPRVPIAGTTTLQRSNQPDHAQHEILLKPGVLSNKLSILLLNKGIAHAIPPCRPSLM